MEKRRGFIGALLIFFAVLVGGLFLFNLPTEYLKVSQTRLEPPVTVDVCGQTIPHNVFGVVESKGCSRTIDRTQDYYYYGSVHSVYGTYFPYYEPRPIGM